MVRALFGFVVLALCGGCPAPGSEADAGSPRDAGAPVDAGDPTVAIFEPSHLVQVDIVIADGGWDVLRAQTRDLFVLLGDDCTAEPFPSPFTDFEGTVTVALRPSSSRTRRRWCSSS